MCSLIKKLYINLKIFFFDNIIKSNNNKMVKIFLKIKLHEKCILCSFFFLQKRYYKIFFKIMISFNFLKALSSKIVIIHIYI